MKYHYAPKCCDKLVFLIGQGSTAAADEPSSVLPPTAGEDKASTANESVDMTSDDDFVESPSPARTTPPSPARSDSSEF